MNLLFLSLEFLTFKNNFHLTPWLCCFPALHSVSQIYFFSIPSGRILLVTDQLFQARDLHSIFYFEGSPPLSLAIFSEQIEARLSWTNFPNSSTIRSRSACHSPCPLVSYLTISLIIFLLVSLISLPPTSLVISSHIFKFRVNLMSKYVLFLKSLSIF